MILNDFNENSFDEIISQALKRELTDIDLVNITNTLAKSGRTIGFEDNRYCDIPSTGGPSSLSTLICPYILVELGFVVPKLGVQGRPAGGIDVLAQIPNYEINQNESSIRKCLEIAKYCHFIADETIVPLDAKFFKYRSNQGYKAIPDLVITSILAKKIAVGIKHVGLDIRYFSGANFGETFDVANENAKKFIRISKILNIDSKCFLSSLEDPLQPYIGRGEALIALNKIFMNEMDSWLREHFDDCLKMCLNFVGADQLQIKNFDFSNLKIHFERNLEAQGSSMKKFRKKIGEIESQKRIRIISPNNGILKIDIGLLRDVFTLIQNEDLSLRFSDAVGIILCKKNNEVIFKGDVLGLLRIEEKFVNRYYTLIMGSFKILNIKVSNLKIIKI